MGIADHICVDYKDLECVAAALDGVQVVLSFILPYADQDNEAQKALIDACIRAGVRRFAPSEWAMLVGLLFHLSSRRADPGRAQVFEYRQSVLPNA